VWSLARKIQPPQPQSAGERRRETRELLTQFCPNADPAIRGMVADVILLMREPGHLVTGGIVTQRSLVLGVRAVVDDDPTVVS
jgi:hypothetical protein